MRHGTHAFSLIELLVVVTIIVILIALLTPALDRAMYESVMAVDGARQKLIVGCAFAYAMDHKRAYPNRANTAAWQISQLVSPSGTQDANGYDLRPVLRDHFPINKAFNDPFSDPVDFEASTLNDYTYASYELWFGFYFYDGLARRLTGMRRIGDRLNWVHPAGSPDAQSYSLNLMVSEWDMQYPTGPQTWGSHPDRDGTASNVRYQSSGIGPAAGATLGNPNANYTFSLWIGPIRTSVDFTAGFQDNSVVRYNDVKWKDDERMVALPTRSNAPDVSDTGLWINAPIR